MRIIGNQTPKGVLSVSGAKNSATRLMAAALLSNEQSKLLSFPTELVDARAKGRYLEDCAVKVVWNQEEDSVLINPSQYECHDDCDFNVPIRTTYLLAAGQLLRNGEARIPYPGGCKIGERKYDLHIMVWKSFGCEVIEREDFIHIKVKGKDLTSAVIDFPISTVGGTENAILCGAVCGGKSIIRNAYITPEVEDLITMLRRMGSHIDLQGNGLIQIEGNKSLRGVNHSVMPDRIEALTWIVYGILSGGDVLINNVPFETMKIPLLHLKDAGIDFFENSRSVYVSPHCISHHGIQPFEVACGTHPGVISDMQPFYVLLALAANGRSKVFDYRYPKRTRYLDELNKFCDNAITYKDGEITIDGPVVFKAGDAESVDLRGSMAIILAALLAENGESNINNPEMALRGYNKLISKLKQLTVEIDPLTTVG